MHFRGSPTVHYQIDGPLINICLHIYQPAEQFTLTCTGLVLRMDKYEAHNFSQFGDEQSIDVWGVH